jgi:hypothetical protein
MTEFERIKRLEAEARRRAELEAKERLHKWNGSRALILAVERAKLGLPLSLEEKALLQASTLAVSYSLAEIEAARNEALNSSAKGGTGASEATPSGPPLGLPTAAAPPARQPSAGSSSESDLIREMIAREAKNLLKLVQTILLSSSTCVTLGDLSSEISVKTGRKWGHDFEPRHGQLLQFLRSEGARSLGLSVHHNKFVSMPNNAHTVPENVQAPHQDQAMLEAGRGANTSLGDQRDALVPYSSDLFAITPVPDPVPPKSAYAQAYDELATTLAGTQLGPSPQQTREAQQMSTSSHNINYSLVFDPFEISQQQQQQQQAARISTTERGRYQQTSSSLPIQQTSSQEFTVTMVSDYLPQAQGSAKPRQTSVPRSYPAPSPPSHEIVAQTTTSYLVNQTTQDVNMSGAQMKMIRGGGRGSSSNNGLPPFSQFNGSGYNAGSGGAIDDLVSHGRSSPALAPIRTARPIPPQAPTATGSTSQTTSQTSSSFSSYHASMRPGHTTSSDTDDDAQYAQALAASFAAEDAENEKLAQFALVPAGHKPSNVSSSMSTSRYPQLEEAITWADFNVLFRPMLNRGFTLVKHGRSGYPKRRHFWFNTSLTRLFWDTSRFLDVLANGDRHIDLRHVIALYDGIQTDLLRRKLAVGEINMDQKNTFFSLVTTTRSYDFQASSPAQQKLLVRALNFLLKQLKQGVNGLTYNQPMHGRAHQQH